MISRIWIIYPKLINRAHGYLLVFAIRTQNESHTVKLSHANENTIMLITINSRVNKLSITMHYHTIHD